MNSEIQINAANAQHYAEILVLNELAIPHVNSISVETLKKLHAQSFSLQIACVSGKLAGFLLALNETAEYSSVNFQWFKNNYPQFTYVDRIVVGSDFRRLGLAKTLYKQLIANIPASCPVLTCEVNLKPENPGSITFHERLGFSRVGEQITGEPNTDAGEKRVCLMAKML